MPSVPGFGVDTIEPSSIRSQGYRTFSTNASDLNRQVKKQRREYSGSVVGGVDKRSYRRDNWSSISDNVINRGRIQQGILVKELDRG